jgi:hypothetical protein
MTWKTRTTQRCVRLTCGVFLFIAAAVLTFPPTTSAHVKWFASYDVTTRPLPFVQAATSTFFMVFAAFLAMLFLGFLADGWVAKRWPGLKAAGSSYVEIHEKWVRLGTGAFLLCMWTIGLNILTPELHTKTAWVFTIQFISAFCVAWRRTCVLSALGICSLYVYGVTQYGLFHMLDYVYFIGIAVFLAGVTISRLSRIRVSAMTGCLAFSIMWTAIEKFVYPQWTRQVLENHGHMAMGMPFGLFIVVAAFVEFTLAFYLATGRGMLRLGTLILLIVFIAAMPEFGRRDVVGHLPLVAILGVPLMGGNSALQSFWRLPRRGVIVNAAAACLLYTVSLSLFFLAYYGVQWLEYRHVAG